MRKKLYQLYQNREGLWRATFEPRIAKVIGPMAHLAIQAPSESSAKNIADILAKHALAQLRQVHEKVLERVNSNRNRRQPTAG